jgi:hypothetical protein
METVRAVLQAAAQVREAEEPAAAVVAQEAADPAVVEAAEAVEVAAEAAEKEVAAVGAEGEVETSHALKRASVVALNVSFQLVRAGAKVRTRAKLTPSSSRLRRLRYCDRSLWV